MFSHLISVLIFDLSIFRTDSAAFEEIKMKNNASIHLIQGVAPGRIYLGDIVVSIRGEEGGGGGEEGRRGGREEREILIS